MIPLDFQSAYDVVFAELDAVKGRADKILQAAAEEFDGLYLSRIKTVASTFEKAVLGSYASPLSTMEDLFAAALVLQTVPTGKLRSALEDRLKERFEIVDTRSNRVKAPSEFMYDDLHYLIRFKDDPTLLDKRLLKWVFELQVKSYLQYGWGMSTRGIAYKASRESWRASRVVAQTRAMVEVADAAIRLEEQFLPLTDDRHYQPIDERSQIADKITAWWKGALPTDLRRLALLTLQLIKSSEVSLDQFETLLASTRGRDLSKKTSLSVQEALLVLIVEHRFNPLVRRLRNSKRFVLVTPVMETFSPDCAKVPNDVRITL